MAEITSVTDAVSELDFLANITEAFLIFAGFEATKGRRGLMLVLCLLLQDPLLNLLHFLRQIPATAAAINVSKAVITQRLAWTYLTT